MPNGDAPPAGARVRIRMYRVGIGDCFLLTFYDGGAERHLLIDCGMYPGGSVDFRGAAAEAEYKERIVRDLIATVDGKLDAVVLTHEHTDHVSMFDQQKDLFDDLQFDQGWFPWVDDEQDEDAKALKEQYEGLGMALRLAVNSMAGAAGFRQEDLAVEKLEGEEDEPEGPVADLFKAIRPFWGFSDFAADGIAKGPRRAIDFVLQETSGKQRFGKPPSSTPNRGRGVSEWEFAGAKFHVLGPPVEPKQLRRMEKAGATYRFAVDQPGPGDPQAPPLLGPRRKDAIVPGGPLESIRARYEEPSSAWRRIGEISYSAVADLALQMNNYTNNTSLVLAIELPPEGSGDVLLFPGDAQVGNWQSWLQGGAERVEKVRGLLARTIVYKVGHHGSHNATLKAGLEAMTNEAKLVALLSTNERYANDSKNWEMPPERLHEELIKRTQGRVLRSDDGVADAPELNLDAEPWRPLREHIRREELYIDYFV